jgi:membrane protein YdbS with pleckstrin-like domain
MTNRQLDFEHIHRVENLTYEPLEKKYIRVQVVGTALAYICLMLFSLFFLFAEELPYRIFIVGGVECLLLCAAVINLMLLPKAYAYKGFAFREHDITYRSGLFFPSVVTIPLGKVQQVSIRQNPVSKLFGLYSIAVVNGAQFKAETVIPGLTEARANEMKTVIMEYIQHGKIR